MTKQNQGYVYVCSIGERALYGETPKAEALKRRFDGVAILMGPGVYAFRTLADAGEIEAYLEACGVLVQCDQTKGYPALKVDFSRRTDSLYNSCICCEPRLLRPDPRF